MNIPDNYEDWRHCITVGCGLTLDRRFIEQRINALEDDQDEYTKNFILHYGEAHLRQVLKWFYHAKQEAK